MKPLDHLQTSDWMTCHSQIADPYNGPSEPPLRYQCKAPEKYRAVESFLRCFLAEVVEGRDILVQLTDRFPTEAPRDFIWHCLVGDAADDPGLAPTCYLFSFEDREQAVSLFAMISCFGWKGYLHGATDQTILYCWEGEFFDFWTSSSGRMTAFVRIAENFGLIIREACES